MMAQPLISTLVSIARSSGRTVPRLSADRLLTAPSRYGSFGTSSRRSLSTEGNGLLSKYDMHSHYIPDFYREILIPIKPDGITDIPAWSPTSHLLLMNKLNIEKSFLSVSSPGVHLRPPPSSASGQPDQDHTEACELAWRCNEYGGKLKRNEGEGRFGLFASLPVLDLEGSLKEIDHALDVCDADGFTLETNTQGVYLGDPRLDPIFSKLNDRKALVTMHPTTPRVRGPSGELISTNPLPYMQPMVEFFFDTARALANLILSGTLTRYPSIRYIVPQAAGALPPLIDRVDAFASYGPAILVHGPRENEVLPFQKGEVKRLIRERFYFDLAGFSLPNQIQGLLPYTDPSRLLYGSDFPWTATQGVETLAHNFDKGVKDLFEDEGVREDIAWKNAKRLLDGGK